MQTLYFVFKHKMIVKYLLFFNPFRRLRDQWRSTKVMVLACYPHMRTLRLFSPSSAVKCGTHGFWSLVPSFRSCHREGRLYWEALPPLPSPMNKIIVRPVWIQGQVKNSFLFSWYVLFKLMDVFDFIQMHSFEFWSDTFLWIRLTVKNAKK